MGFTEWLSLFAISLVGAMSPGPSLAVVVKNTLGSGRISGILTSWAHAVGIGFYALFTMLGLAVVLKNNETLFHIISYAGALYLAWLGFKALRSSAGVVKTAEKGRALNYTQSMREGIMISLLNPKIGLFFIALFSQFVTPDVGLSGQIATVLTPFLTDGLWYTFIAFIISNPKILEKLRQKASIIDKITGILLILLAIKILFN